MRYLENPEYAVDSVATDDCVDAIRSVTPDLTRDVRAYKIREINFAFYKYSLDIMTLSCLVQT